MSGGLFLASHIESPEEQLGPFFSRRGEMAVTLKSYVLEAAVSQIKAWLSEPLINHFWALGLCIVSEK